MCDGGICEASFACGVIDERCKPSSCSVNRVSSSCYNPPCILNVTLINTWDIPIHLQWWATLIRAGTWCGCVLWGLPRIWPHCGDVSRKSVRIRRIGVQKCEEHESGTENDQQFKSTSRFEHVFVRLAQWTSSEHVSDYKIKNRQLSLLLLISPHSIVLIMLTLGTS